MATYLALVLGCKLARTEPTMYSFTDYGARLYPSTYNFLIAVSLGAAVVCFVLAAVTRRKAV